MKVAIRTLLITLLVAAATVAPCIARIAGVVENPVPTTVTVVPTDGKDGLTTVMVGAITVYGIELNPVTLALIWCSPPPADGTMTAAQLVSTIGQVKGAAKGVATQVLSNKISPGAMPQ